MVQKKTSFDSVFHYTSERALFGIVQKDGLHFRASRYDCMNDSEEYKWLYEPLKVRISEEQGLPKDEVNNLYEKFPYVISFSEREEEVAMWAKYGGGGNGVCLVLNKELIVAEAELHFKEESDVAMPVRYADEKTKMEILAEVVEDFRNQGYGTANQQEMFEDEVFCSAFVKNKALWEEESEFRYARIRERGMVARYSVQGGKLSYPEDKCGVQIRPDKPIPYLEIVFPLKVLDKVIVGPNIDAVGLGNIKNKLQNTVCKEIDVIPSKVKF